MGTNLKNHSVDSSSMGLTLRQCALKKTDTPYYYEVKNADGQRHLHCGSMVDVERILKTYPDFTYEKIYLPPSPKTVNVPYTTVAPDPKLSAQQILPERQQEPLNLSL